MASPALHYIRCVICFFSIIFFYSNACSTEGNWTWVKGGTDNPTTGVYGILGIAAPENYPAGQAFSAQWTDNDGNLWLYGGHGYGSRGGPDSLCAMWKYTPATGNWTWVSGNSLLRQPPVYGNKGEAAPENHPGSRVEAATWKDNFGNLWLFGGFHSVNSGSFHNDLWKFEVKSEMWTWVSGSKDTNLRGIYGVLGEPGTANAPGSRFGSGGWTDAAGNLWLFGGFGYADTSGGSLNDLWKFNVENQQWRRRARLWCIGYFDSV